MPFLLGNVAIITLHLRLGFSDDLAELRLEYKTHLTRQAAELSQLYTLNKLAQLMAELHKIKGTSGSFGLTTISQAAAECLQLLKQQQNCDVPFNKLLALLKTT